MPKVEIAIIFLLIASFQMALIISTPSFQLDYFTRILVFFASIASMWMQSIVGVTSRVTKQTFNFFSQLFFWIFYFGRIYSPFYIWYSLLRIKIHCQLLHLSWKWWLVYLSSFWDEPGSRSILEIFRDPQGHQILMKAGNRILPSGKVDRKYQGRYWDNIQADLNRVSSQIRDKHLALF